MRNLHELDRYRAVGPDVIKIYGSTGDDKNGIFRVGPMLVIASSGWGWDHVSVSLADRCPDWHEMEKIKRMFFKDDEVAMQLHVPPNEHINYCETALHLWRPLNEAIPRPPAIMVGPEGG